MASVPSAAVTTTGFRCTPSVERIATWGWLITGNCIMVPYWPGLVMVKVPPAISSADSFFWWARSARSRISRAMARRRLDSVLRTTGASRPSKSRSTAMARCTGWCTSSSPSPTEAFRWGKSSMASTTARATNGR